MIMAPARKSQDKDTSALSIHPPYFQMIGDAITALKDRQGSSHSAIAKYIQDKYSTVLPPNFRKMLSIQLRRFVRAQKLIKTKNSYKISTLEKAQMVSFHTLATNNRTVLERANAPPAEKKTSKKETAKTAGKKMKRLSQVKTPERMKRKSAATPPKIKMVSKSPKQTARPAKKLKK